MASFAALTAPAVFGNVRASASSGSRAVVPVPGFAVRGRRSLLPDRVLPLTTSVARKSFVVRASTNGVSGGSGLKIDLTGKCLRWLSSSIHFYLHVHDYFDRISNINYLHRTPQGRRLLLLVLLTTRSGRVFSPVWHLQLSKRTSPSVSALLNVG